jgi:transketolase
MQPTQRRLANAIRALAMDAVEAANSGHPGMPMGMADAATALFTRHLKFDPADPTWPDRDRFVLSAGHGSMLVYALLHLTGYARPTIDDIRNFRKLDSPCAGHPESFMLSGIETTTGPLGQGFAAAIDGSTDLSRNEDVMARYDAMGWHTVETDGMDSHKVAQAIDKATSDARPSLIRCKTIIGYGAPKKQGTAATHGAALGADEVAAARKELGWTDEPFVIPDDVSKGWKSLGSRGATARAEWHRRVAANPKGQEYLDRIGGKANDAWLKPHLDGLIAKPQGVATRKASELALEAINEALASTIGGSADLTPSNNTQTKNIAVLDSANYGGRYVHYGIREFGMAAAMNGMAQHGGIIPYGGTFMVFSDYSRPAIRLGALQKAKVIHVMTHDSIGLGEDGPTHQPVEHLQALRAIPQLTVYRPADAVETAECWAAALADDGPSLLALSRQNVRALRTKAEPANLSAKGAYRLVAATGARKVILIATGTEVEIAVDVAAALEEKGIGADVISMPSTDRFDDQDDSYREDILPDVSNRDILRVSIEAGITRGWERYTGLHGLRIGLDRFGASAPAPDLYQYFGLTAEAIVPKILEKLGK